MGWLSIAIDAIGELGKLIADSLTLSEEKALERLNTIIASTDVKLNAMRASMKAAQEAGDKALREKFPDDEVTQK